MVAVKTVAGFLNSRLGGTLFIGIADDKKIVGLDRDYESLVKLGENRGGQDKDRDRFQLHLRNLLAAKIGREVSNLCVETAILSPDGKDVCVVAASPSPMPVYVADAKGKTFYLRGGAATVGLDVEEAIAYGQERWPRPLWARVRRWTRSA
jgi:predicted HTH transcriptional regulator